MFRPEGRAQQVLQKHVALPRSNVGFHAPEKLLNCGVWKVEKQATRIQGKNATGIQEIRDEQTQPQTKEGQSRSTSSECESTKSETSQAEDLSCRGSFEEKVGRGKRLYR